MRPEELDNVKEDPLVRNLLRQSTGDRLLLLLVALAIGLPTGGFLYAIHVLEPENAPTTLGALAFLDFLWMLLGACILSVMWALFRPKWIIGLLRRVALKVYLVAALFFIGFWLWLLYQWLGI